MLREPTALTRDFKETIKARAERDPAFREALLTEAVEQLITVLSSEKETNPSGVLLQPCSGPSNRQHFVDNISWTVARHHREQWWKQ